MTAVNTAKGGASYACELRQLGPADKRDFIALMADAFSRDPSFGYFFGESGRARAATRFLSFIFDVSRIQKDDLRGAFHDGRLVACSIVEHTLKPSLSRTLSFVRISLEALFISALLPRGSLLRLQRYMALARGSLPEGKWRYLTMLGASFENQGKGFGAALLDAALADMEADRFCDGLALDTENERNLPFYQGRGFQLLAAHSLDGMSVFSMARPQARSGS